MTGRTGPDWPWRDSDVVMVCLTTIVGAAAFAAGWFGATVSGTVHHQAAWLNLAVGGFATSAVGVSLWLMRGRRAVGERRVALVSIDPPDAEPRPAPGRWPDADGTRDLVRAVGMQRVHRPDCPLVAGKQLERADEDDGQPCGVCLP
ncbi:hypothetical protein H0B56_09355 [Haloechinothrix sp. YIM 98757]|uniref:Uncharacterized protein n=1 Tax=Haloechinothrix aidingensis TaxID=2752311 RepID=A0A838A8K9_9PSEU|nr:hypothetical protein [Haloechinothrix aidingensis]MBA0125745.1 hypothetical protein [Haloechinothrix aidingensis]